MPGKRADDLAPCWAGWFLRLGIQEARASNAIAQWSQLSPHHHRHSNRGKRRNVRSAPRMFLFRQSSVSTAAVLLVHTRVKTLDRVPRATAGLRHLTLHLASAAERELKCLLWVGKRPLEYAEQGGSVLRTCVQTSVNRRNAELGCYFGNPFSKRLALVPPKPKLLERIVSISVEF